MSLFTLFFKPIGRQAVHQVLLQRARYAQQLQKGRWSRRDVKKLVDETWQRYAAFEPRLPHEATIGSRFSVRLATLDICLHQALLEMGTGRDDAIQLVHDVNWHLYKKGMKLPKWLASLITRDPVQQMQVISNLIMTKFPFNPPGFQSKMLASERGGRFDVLRCPVADQMQALLPEQEARNLCVATWCNQDYAAAELWGGRLERSGTIASGADRCDFHFVGD